MILAVAEALRLVVRSSWAEPLTNGVFGIHVKHQSLVRGNNLSDNGAVGVGGGLHLEGTHSVAEDNLAADNDFRGYWVVDPSNFLRRNTAGGNAINWQVSAGNFLRVLDAVPNAGIFGDVGGATVGPYDPNANYSL